MAVGAFRGWVRIVRGWCKVARFAAYPRCWADTERGHDMMVEILSAILLAAGPGRAMDFWSHFTEESQIMWPAPGDAEGGVRLMLVRLDLDRDGHPEIIIGQSGSCGNGGCGWRCYKELGSHRVSYLGSMGFHPGFFAFSNGMLTTCSHVSAMECILSQYTIREGRIAHRRLGSCGEDLVCGPELARIRRYQVRHPAAVLWAEAVAKPIVWRRGKGEVVPIGLIPDFSHMLVVQGAR